MSEPVKIIPPLVCPHNKVIGCCNSLVCILYYDNLYSPCDDFEIVIWNPSIKKYKRLPFVPTEPIEDNFLQQSLAFGYDPVNNDYKVLMIVFVSTDFGIKPLEIMVYSLKAHSWRRVEDQWPCKDSKIWSGTFFSNGAFHWLIDTTRARTLLAFDLITEKFRMQATPFKSYSIVGLNVLEGSLCVSVNTKDKDIGFQRINVWTMKEYGVASSWSRLYTVRRSFFHFRSFAFSKDGKKVLMQNRSRELFWHDTNKKTWSIVDKNVRRNSPNYWAMSCVESLLLLDGDSDN
jgi:F-box interacting protein